MVFVSTWSYLIFLIVIANLCTICAQETKPSGYLIANRVTIFTRKGEFEYNFSIKEGSVFTCFKTSGKYVQLTYIDKENTQSSGFRQNDSVSFYLMFDAANNDTSLKCIFTNDIQSKEEYVIQLRMVAHEDMRGILGFRVNDFILPRSKDYGIYGYYDYYYYADENITVSVIKDNDLYKEVCCSVNGENIPKELSDYFTRDACKNFSNVNLTINRLQEPNGTKTAPYMSCIIGRKDGGLCYIMLRLLFGVADYKKNDFIISSKTPLKEMITSTFNTSMDVRRRPTWPPDLFGVYKNNTPAHKNEEDREETSKSTFNSIEITRWATVIVLSIVCTIQILAFIVWQSKKILKKRSQKQKSLIKSDRTNSNKDEETQPHGQPYYENASMISPDLPVVEEVIYDVADSLVVQQDFSEISNSEGYYPPYGHHSDFIQKLNVKLSNTRCMEVEKIHSLIKKKTAEDFADSHF